jgi:hypothetical protein
LSEQQRREIEKKKKIESERLQRKRDLLYTLAVEIRKALKIISNVRSIQQMEIAADLYHLLPYWEHCHDVLIHGDHQDVQAVVDVFKGLKLIKRKPLFKPDFDYRQWLKDFENG